MLALLMLNVERFLGLTYPIFHRTSVTKNKLLFVLIFLMILSVGLSLLMYYKRTLGNILLALFMSIFVFLVTYFNYRMFTIAKSKRKPERIAPTTSTSGDQKRKRHKVNFKRISTCSLVVACYVVCSCPQIIYSSLRFLSETPLYDRRVLLQNLWSGAQMRGGGWGGGG
jgi:vacuolar-type H+-ATPase subunit I/STV1